MEKLTLVMGVIAMVAAAVLQFVIVEVKIEEESYCTVANKDTYMETLIAGSILMFLNWLIGCQDGLYETRWISIIAVIYMALFFLNVLEEFHLDRYRSPEKRWIYTDIKKSSIIISIIYFAFGYLVS